MYEFIDKERFEVEEMYWDFMESEEQDVAKGIKELKSMIQKDPDFFDPYVVLFDYYHADNKPMLAFEIIKDGYNRAMKMIVKKGKFPDELSWMFMENRHIIRIIFQYAMLMWEVGEKDEALRIFQQLLGSNPNDNIGARYVIVAMLDGMASMREYEEKFETKEGYLDGNKVEKWFQKAAKKYPDEIGWWFDMEDK
jgi:tetratricopeptide (TPR) repeat protein